MEPPSLNGYCSLEAQAWEPMEGEARRDGIVVVFEDDMQVRGPRSFVIKRICLSLRPSNRGVATA